MKKIVIVLIAAIFMCLSAFALPSGVSTIRSAAAIQTTAVSEQAVKDLFLDFVAANPNRVGFNVDNKGGEADAADYIHSKLLGFGYNESQLIVDTFSKEFEVSSGSIFQAQIETRYSKNVTLRLLSVDSSVKSRVVVGCDYDNTYNNTTLSVGAIDNASGVASVLALAQSLIGQALPFNIDIVFFGAGYYDYAGSDDYVQRYGLSNVEAMINVTRVGMNDVYLYCDEKTNLFEELLLSNSDFIKKMPSNIPLLNNEYVEGYPYAHIGMAGNHSRFLSRGVTCANIFGGDSSIASLRWGIEYDTTADMERLYPDCYKNMAQTTSLLSTVLFAEGFIAAAKDSKSALDSPLLKPWIAYIIFISLAAMVFLALWFISRHYITKYPIVTQRKVMPVFGSDYE